MKTIYLPICALFGVLLLALCLGPQDSLAQEISVYQYRDVPAEHVAEFIYRETTYWSQVAQKAVDEDKLEFWGLFQKMGGYDLPNSSNFLFINSFKDIDASGGIWDASAVFPDVPIEEMDTFSLSTVTSMFYVRPDSFVTASHAVPADDFNYVGFVYHNASNSGELIALENEHWAPFIKAAMDDKKTTQVGWGNATILSPLGEDIKANTISFDIYPSLKEALDPTWDEDTVFPEEGLAKINELELNRRGTVIYRVVQVVSAPPEE